MALKLSLKPGEAFILNGAVLRNGERRGVLLLENRARILREKDIMQPEEADTPAKRAYFAIMQMYLAGDNEGSFYDHATLALADLVASCTSQHDRDAIVAIASSAAVGDLYRALTQCREIMRALEPAQARQAVAL